LVGLDRSDVDEVRPSVQGAGQGEEVGAPFSRTRRLTMSTLGRVDRGTGGVDDGGGTKRSSTTPLPT